MQDKDRIQLIKLLLDDIDDGFHSGDFTIAQAQKMNELPSQPILQPLAPVLSERMGTWEPPDYVPPNPIELV